MELLVGALEEALPSGKLPFRARKKSNVQRGDAQFGGQRGAGLQQDRFAFGLIGTGAHEQTTPRDRRKGHRHLKLGIVTAAGALIGIGPAMIEHIFALAVRFQIAGHAGGKRAVAVLEQQMARQPAGQARG